MTDRADRACDLLENLPFRLTAQEHVRPRVGIVALASDYTLEHELRRAFAPSAVDYFVTRIASSPIITPESLVAMGPLITATVDLILPGDALDVVAFACTSASMVLGEEAVATRLHAARPGAKATTPISAALRALAAFDARRVAVLTPYRRDVNEIMLAYLQGRGLEIPVFGSFSEPDDRNVARIDAASLKSAIRRIVAGREVDAVFISCTSVKALLAIPEIEAEIGLPVISSNQALAWDCLRLAGAVETSPAFGRLFAIAPAAA
jgi:maleate isomerase